MTNLDEWKDKWAEHDRKLDRILRVNHQLLSETCLAAARASMKRLLVLLILEIAVWVLIAGALGSLIASHRGEPVLWISALLVDVYAIGVAALLIRQLVATLRLDYAAPVAAIQRRLEEVRVLRVRTTQWAVLAGVAVWAPALIVCVEGMLGVGVHRWVSVPWLAANIAFGLALAPLAVWLSREFGDRMANSPFLQRLMWDLGGTNLNAAATSLATLSRFEQE